MHHIRWGMPPSNERLLGTTASALQCVQAWESIQLSLTPIVELNDAIACTHRSQSARKLFIAGGGCRYVHEL